jgi:phage gp29-like protein
MAKNRHRRAVLAKQNASRPTPDTEMQTGPRSSLGHTLNYASVITVPPARLASAFAMADQGQITEQSKLFNLIEEHDSHIFAEMAKRKRAITSLGWQLEATEDATEPELKRTEELEQMLRENNGFETMQYDLADATGKGFAMIEMEWKKGDVWLPECYHYVPQQLFVTDQDTAELKYNGTGLPEALIPFKWIKHIHKAKSGYLESSALFRVLAWTYAYKAYNVQDMQRFLELYGLPLRLGKYPPGIGKTQRDELLRAVRSIGNDGAGVVPANMTIDFIKDTSRGSIADFLDAIAYWEEKQSKAILGGDLDGKTTTEARIMVYDKVRREILLHDVGNMEPTINQQLLAPINMYNGMFEPGRMPKFKYLTQESVDQQKMVTVLEKGVALGMEIEVEYAHEVMQIPRAKKGAALLGKPAQTTPAGNVDNNNNPTDTPPADQVQGALSRLAALAKTHGAQADLTDAYTAQLAALGAKHESALVQQIYDVIGAAGDYDAAIEGIEALAVQFKVPALTEVIALGMAAANLGGRSEVIDGN